MCELAGSDIGMRLLYGRASNEAAHCNCKNVESRQVVHRGLAEINPINKVHKAPAT